ncbi:cathepsin B [Elysia marginata]|uniref:Cathepsin B n=1 Tax=Elysia marginata TaxID=1093978 RepID=A0AAV4F2P6_9GAST|nr:cathepsin B [Elysia marginata]
MRGCRGCQPYSLPPCNHHVSGDLPNCSHPFSPTPECVKECSPGYHNTYEKDKHFGVLEYRVLGETSIMRELYYHGPVTATFTVYSDFPSYKSGVYTHRHGPSLGGHAVKLLGWGTENGLDYWLAANSWNTNWGDQGFFKIAKGRNECGFESYIVTGLPLET